MIDRISKNEERLESINICLKNVENSLDELKKNKKNIKLLNNYYGSINWFKDKESYENNKIPKIKAGVLSEDAVRNMNENIDELILEMQSIVEEYMKNKNLKGD